MVALALGRFGLERPLRLWLGDYFSPRSAALIALLAVQVTLVVPFGFRMLRLTRARLLQSARPGTIFVGSFAIAIAIRHADVKDAAGDGRRHLVARTPFLPAPARSA
ncbi:MAG: hypothetical protein R3F11_23355 [Verrucomicrobiales bacterium]